MYPAKFKLNYINNQNQKAMKKITPLSLFLGAIVICTNVQSQNFCKELFISEHMEGSQKNQAIEVYNPTLDAIDLSQYSLKIYKNGNANNPTVVQFAGTILLKSDLMEEHHMRPSRLYYCN